MTEYDILMKLARDARKISDNEPLALSIERSAVRVKRLERMLDELTQDAYEQILIDMELDRIVTAARGMH